MTGANPLLMGTLLLLFSAVLIPGTFVKGVVCFTQCTRFKGKEVVVGKRRYVAGFDAQDATGMMVPGAIETTGK